jgi:menaquinone-9 beta-reductase
MRRGKPILIVGGGPAGSFTALHLLARRPDLADDILLLDARPLGRDKICAGGVAGRVIKGAAGELDIDLSGLEGRDAAGLIVKFEGRVSVTERPGLARVIRRNILDAHLLGRVMERGVEVRTGTAVTGVRRIRDGIAVETRDGLLEAKVLVGADGVNGVTKKSLGVAAGRAKEYLWMVEVPGADVPPMLALDYTPILSDIPGYAWVFPTADGANAGITGGSAGNMKNLRTQLERTAAESFGLALDQPGLEFKIYPERFFSFGVASHAERVLYVGDKLGVTPMTGEGIGICFSSGRAAALEIIAALRGNDFSFRRYPWRLAASDFVPTWFMEYVFMKWKSARLFDLFFKLATSENRPGGSFLDDYCRIFAGEVPAQSLAGWGVLLKALPSRKLLGEMARRRVGRITG